jgi:hypothetical protein
MPRIAAIVGTRQWRIAVIDGLNIDAQNRAPFRPIGQHFLKGLTQQDALHIRMVETFAYAIDDAFLQRPVIDDRGIEEGGQKRIPLGGCTRFFAHAAPDGIDDLYLARAVDLANVRCCDHWRSPDFLSVKHYIE